VEEERKQLGCASGTRRLTKHPGLVMPVEKSPYTGDPARGLFDLRVLGTGN